MLKRVMIFAVLAGMFGANPSSANPARWEYQGQASTGEPVHLDLNSIAVVSRSLGLEKPPSYFFRYQIGKDRIFAMTHCDGQFYTSSDGDVYQNLVRPKSGATRNMVDRACRYHRKTVRVFAPPSNVRMGADGKILCTIREQRTITTYGQSDDWLYTNACGKLGLIHSSQIR